ncbi:unnamed protein product, partial [Durusdinium trenchii]
VFSVAIPCYGALMTRVETSSPTSECIGDCGDGDWLYNAFQYEFKLWNYIIRPPRVIYDETDLGPTEFVAGGVRATRRDFKLRTHRGVLLSCSFFAPSQDGKAEIQRFPVVIYLHGNSSSRLEACNLVGALISQRIALFCFDAAGCGQSEGEYVSLGWHERDDLAAQDVDSKSSGQSLSKKLKGALCLDSSFASLRQLVEEFAQSKNIPLPVPSWLVGAALAVVRLRVKALADFDIEDLVPLQHARCSLAPAIFLHGKKDDFVDVKHSRQLYEVYAGSKEFIAVDGDHNSERGGQVVGHVISFFKRCLRPAEQPMVPTLLWDPQFAVPSLDGVPLRVPMQRHSSTDLAKKDKKRVSYVTAAAKACRHADMSRGTGARQLTFSLIPEARP